MTDQAQENILENLKEKMPDSDYFQLQTPPALPEESSQKDKIETEEIPAEIGEPLNSMQIQSCIEALLFITDKPLTAKAIQLIVGSVNPLESIYEALNKLMSLYSKTAHGIEIICVAEGYQFRTKIEHAPLMQKLAKVQVQRLSSGAMESLAIIAYQQPITKDELDKIRGVDSSHFIRSLLDKNFIKILGRSELPGKPIIYGTTPTFLEFFGLSGLDKLPSLREIEQMIPGSEATAEDPEFTKLSKQVKNLTQEQTRIEFNPQEDAEFLAEIKKKVDNITSTTPFLEDLKKQLERPTNAET